MKRRDFLNKGLAAGLLAGSSLSFGKMGKVLASDMKVSQLPYDLVAVRDGLPGEMFDKGITSMGGMQKFVKKGQTVVVKPNMAWDTSPERAANTNPELIARVVEHCIKAGAKEVYVFDHTCDNWQRAYQNSGIEEAARDAGARVVPANDERFYKDVQIPGGVSLTSAKEHELILSSDVFINVPILKSHGGATLTVAMKNLMGNVWDRRFWHRNNLHQCIADFASYRKPDLNIVDAYRVMKRNGPRGVSTADVVSMNSLLISPDIVAVDTAATRMFGLEPDSIGHIKLAHDMGVGTMDLDSLRINRIRV